MRQNESSGYFINARMAELVVQRRTPGAKVPVLAQCSAWLKPCPYELRNAVKRLRAPLTGKQTLPVRRPQKAIIYAHLAYTYHLRIKQHAGKAASRIDNHLADLTNLRNRLTTSRDE